MEIPQDFRELLALLNAHDVDYMIVGAYALAYHGAPRFTGDLDLLVRPDEENAARIVRVLDEFGFGKVGIDQTDLVKPDQIIQLGVSPVRIDIITSITGVSWQEARRGRQKGRFGDLEVYYIGKQQFVTNKKATGRQKDLADLEALGITS
jgi:hypothetical protein